MQYFGSKIVEGVAESWVEAEMSCVQVDGAEWRWVHGLVIPKKYLFQTENLLRDQSPRNYCFEHQPIHNIEITVHGTNTVNFITN